MKMKMIMKNRSQKQDIKRPRGRHKGRDLEVEVNTSIQSVNGKMMYVCSKKRLSNI